ncbi:MAG: hypothetical protein ACXVP1_01685, partial [Thermoleophilia bacterium]
CAEPAASAAEYVHQVQRMATILGSNATTTPIGSQSQGAAPASAQVLGRTDAMCAANEGIGHE